MSKMGSLKTHLRSGRVYRRADLEQWSNAVDRHLAELLKAGILQKVAPGLYYYPRNTVFGPVPPEDEALVAAFLKDDEFLLTTPNDYNKLGVGTTQLYNKTVVYNRKRHEEVKLGNRWFSFQRKPDFPAKVTQEFLMVDLVNNLGQLAEDETIVLSGVRRKIASCNPKVLRECVHKYGKVGTKKFFTASLTAS